MAEAWWMGNGDDVQSAARVMSFYITQHERLVRVPDIQYLTIKTVSHLS